ncbi:hypothetical protein XU18_1447 [Perkinsela sp. CCAP 1560/4]|nr:hypothetical protein XU18_1447 [Perkinsela sp. CCAP 1560/4]|eukprot:KNH07968.1 hypothetical protein XU18_1447 [Perkinsela sp. CCAP 1560/4]
MNIGESSYLCPNDDLVAFDPFEMCLACFIRKRIHATERTLARHLVSEISLNIFSIHFPSDEKHSETHHNRFRMTLDEKTRTCTDCFLIRWNLRPTDPYLDSNAVNQSASRVHQRVENTTR